MYAINNVQIPVVDPNNVGSYTFKTAAFADFATNYQPFQTTLPFTYTLYENQYTPAIVGGADILGADVVSNWGDNDDYIITAMATKIGVTLI